MKYWSMIQYFGFPNRIVQTTTVKNLKENENGEAHGFLDVVFLISLIPSQNLELYLNLKLCPKNGALALADEWAQIVIPAPVLTEPDVLAAHNC